MLELVASIVPLALASSLSPGLLAVSVALLAKGNERALWAFVFGGALAALLVALAGASVAENDHKIAAGFGLHPKAADLLFGAAFLLFGLKTLLEKPKEGGMAQRGIMGGAGAKKWLAVGFLANITNADAVLLNFAAVRQVFNSAIALPYQLALAAFCGFFFLSPSLAPLLLYRAAPGRCARLLEPAGKWMERHSHLLVGAIFALFGLYLLALGL
ncbi:MAG: GAP family protein [Candidatus Micrarchaeota archaeon]|nr:GAP family protein [Candidatus Micrarchaeota archaeon]